MKKTIVIILTSLTLLTFNSCDLGENEVYLIEYNGEKYVSKGYVPRYSSGEVEFTDYKTGNEVRIRGEYKVTKLN